MIQLGSTTVSVNDNFVLQLVGLKKLELKMAMCCMKCAEIISEKLREVPGECIKKHVVAPHA